MSFDRGEGVRRWRSRVVRRCTYKRLRGCKGNINLVEFKRRGSGTGRKHRDVVFAHKLGETFRLGEMDLRLMRRWSSQWRDLHQ
jgi:hypothetical protein